MSLQDIRRRIRSVRGTQQITKAMKMVAAAKLRKAQDRMLAVRPYSAKLNAMLRDALSGDILDTNPLLDRDEPAKDGELFLKKGDKPIGLIIIASDRGLCGAFNTNIIRVAKNFIDENREHKFQLITVGKKIDKFFRKRDFDIINSYSDIYDSVSYSAMNFLAGHLIDKFLQGELKQVLVLYSEFVNVVKQKQILKQIVPIMPAELAKGHTGEPGGEKEEEPQKDKAAEMLYIVEPGQKELNAALLRRCITSEIHHAVLESIASEHGARMSAMDLATKNADEMIDNLTLDMNRARQAAITGEIVEISSGAEAMKQK